MNRIVLFVAPSTLMMLAAIGTTGIEHWLAPFGKSDAARQMLGRAGIALPYVAASVVGIVFLFASAGSVRIKTAGWGVVTGAIAALLIAVMREASRLSAFFEQVPAGRSIFNYLDPATAIGTTTVLMSALFGVRVAIAGNAAFAKAEPKRIVGKRALHGDADWMKLLLAEKLFPETGGVVIGECYRVDRDSTASQPFRAGSAETWGAGGKSPLLCFDGSFGSSHGIVFAGSGGFKTTSVTIPTALTWGAALVVLDPSNEVAPIVSKHRGNANRDVFVLDPKQSEIGFNALDWIGRFGGTKEEDIASVASWIISDSGGARGFATTSSAPRPCNCSPR